MVKKKTEMWSGVDMTGDQSSAAHSGYQNVKSLMLRICCVYDRGESFRNAMMTWKMLGGN
jgi:hypothetical protein